MPYKTIDEGSISVKIHANLRFIFYIGSKYE